MKHSFLLLFGLLPAMAFAQQNYTITGKIGGLNAPAKIYLQRQIDNKVVTDTAKVVNGTFSFQGKVDDPVTARLLLDHEGTGMMSQQRPDMLNLYVEAGTTTIQSPDSLSKAIISGSPTNAQNKQLMTLLQPIIVKQRALYAEYQAATTEQRQSQDFMANIEKRDNDIDAEQKQILSAFIEANPGSFVSLVALRSLAGPTPDPDKLEPIFNQLSDNIKKSKSGQAFTNALVQLRTTSIGATAPDFTMNNPEGKPITLSGFRGKYLLLDFWASWCGPCRAENPNVVAAYNRYKDKNFTILGVSLDKEDGKAAWLEAIQKDGLAWNQVSDLKFWNNAAAQLYQVRSIPQNFLIDPNGKIIAKNLRGEDLEKKLSEIFGGK